MVTVDSEALDATIERSHRYLLDVQFPDGYWWGELESNPTMEAEYVMLLHFLGIADEERSRKLVNHILSQQREDGTWCQFYGAPGDLSTSTECYFALKLAGASVDTPRMRRAREFIISKGGVANTRVFTKIWLSLFGQYDWRGVPVMPPEIMLLPGWSPITIYDFSSWARATIVPLLILLDRKPVKPVPEDANIDELYVVPRDETDYSIKRPKRLIGWETFFYAGDTVLRYLDRLPWRPAKSQALKRAEEWIIRRQEADGSWGGIQPPWVYSLMALKELGYPLDHPVMTKGIKGFEAFSIENDDSLKVQACISPLWDTCLALIGLLDSGMSPDHPAVIRAAEWLVKEQILGTGDWQIKAKEVPPGGWAFEFHNDTYPDLDDTAEIVMALNKLRLPDEDARRMAIDRAVRWLEGMQSNNGGWAAFDKDNSKVLIAKIPFADFGETIDPPSVDVTAHVVEMMGQLGYAAEHPAIARALAYILQDQEADGPWFGRWGVNYIYGTGAVLPALAEIGIDMRAPFVRRAVQWLFEHQNPDGGWGESCASYVDEAFRGRGPSTASQTAWALIALLAAGESDTDATRRGVNYLLETQEPDGGWEEPYFTGTGFPGYGVGLRPDRYLGPDDPSFQGSELPAGFMIKYHMYRNYWPLMALGRYRSSANAKTDVSRRSDVAHIIDMHALTRKTRRTRLKKIIPIW